MPVFTLDIPKDTAKTAYKLTRMIMPSGIMTKCNVTLHDGSQGGLHAGIYLGGHQAFPWNAENDFHIPGMTYRLEPMIMVERGQHWEVRGWSDCANYSHEVVVFVEVQKPEVLSPSIVASATQKTAELMEKFLAAFGVTG